MALNFEPERIVYDPEESLMRFFATERGTLVRCGISTAALAALEDSGLGGADEIVSSFFRHRDLTVTANMRNKRELAELEP